MPRDDASLLELGESFLARGEADKAEKVLRKAVRKLKGDRRRLADAMISLGVTLYRRGKFKASLKTFMKALGLSEREGYKPGVARSYSGLGLIYLSLKRPLEEVLKYHEKAIEIARETGNPKVEAKVLNNMGLTYVMSDEPEKALMFLRESLEKARASCEKYVEAVALINMAGALRLMGRLNEEVDARRKAIAILDELGNVRDASANRVELAYALRQLRRLDEATEAAEQAMRGFLQVKDKRMAAAAEEIIKRVRVRGRECPSCKAVILVEDLEYCPLCDTLLVKEEPKGLRLPRLGWLRSFKSP